MLESRESYTKLFDFITKIYNCEEVTNDELLGLDFVNGISVEIILYVLKWLFIEQDITYWKRSGRDMLYSHICKIWEQ